MQEASATHAPASGWRPPPPNRPPVTSEAGIVCRVSVLRRRRLRRCSSRLPIPPAPPRLRVLPASTPPRTIGSPIRSTPGGLASGGVKHTDCPDFLLPGGGPKGRPVFHAGGCSFFFVAGFSPCTAFCPWDSFLSESFFSWYAPPMTSLFQTGCCLPLSYEDRCQLESESLSLEGQDIRLCNGSPPQKKTR
jgi:hypothetical protein